MADDSGSAAIDVLAARLDELERRVAGLTEYREQDLQATLGIERQIALLQEQITRLVAFFERIAGDADDQERE